MWEGRDCKNKEVAAKPSRYQESLLCLPHAIIMKKALCAPIHCRGDAHGLRAAAFPLRATYPCYSDLPPSVPTSAALSLLCVTLALTFPGGLWTAASHSALQLLSSTRQGAEACCGHPNPSHVVAGCQVLPGGAGNSSRCLCVRGESAGDRCPLAPQVCSWPPAPASLLGCDFCCSCLSLSARFCPFSDTSFTFQPQERGIIQGCGG